MNKKDKKKKKKEYKGRLIPEARFQNEPFEEHHLRDLIDKEIEEGNN
jgi:hypothetical protein